MDLVVPTELEELILCTCCHLPFNDTDSLPKFLSCRHHFCLKCIHSILSKSGELYCVHCWKRTELPAPDMKPDNLPTNTAVLYLTENLNMLNMKSKQSDKQQHQQQHQHQHQHQHQQQQQQSVSQATASAVAQSLLQSPTPSNPQPPANHQSNNNIVMKKGENCHTHAMPNSLWCLKCNTTICRACAGGDEHRSHTVKSHNEAKETIRGDIANELLTLQKTLIDVQHLVLKQRDFLLKILEASTSLKTQIETELINHIPTLEIAEMRESLGKAKLCMSMLDQQTPTDAYKLYTTIHLEKQRLQSKHQELYLQCKLDDVIRQYGSLFDFDLIKQALAGLQANGGDSMQSNAMGHNNSILLLANYCISQLYSRHVLTNKQVQMISNGNGSNGNGYSISPQMLNNSQSTLGTQEHHKTFAEIAGSPKPVSVSNYTNHLKDAIGSHSSQQSQTSTTTQAVAAVASASNAMHRQTPSSFLSEMNGMSVPITMIQHLQHSTQQQMSVTTTLGQSSQGSSLICNPTVHVYPLYYFNIEINGGPCGRILIEVRNDVAPKMAKNFGALASGELGFGYKGCHIFQCWENESIITGDFELNNGRGGRSVFEEGYFMPDDTKILAVRGSVGMRRSQKRHDNMGLVGSQFRIILREMRGFTGIFAFVVEGLELVEKISQAGDSAGKPQSNVMIVSCGKLQ